jgi:hypothetical protein
MPEEYDELRSQIHRIVAAIAFCELQRCRHGLGWPIHDRMKEAVIQAEVTCGSGFQHFSG